MSKRERVEADAPLFGGPLEGVLVLGALLTVALVALWFKLDVNRVFDVPKALALKVGGSGLFLVWILYGLLGRGYPWKSVRLFFGPVLALVVVVVISTALSIDPMMSLTGVYERQFGLEGFLSCVGLFLVTATSLRTRRGAVMVLGALALIGGLVGSYAFLQSRGLDPFGFFAKPHTKVYATLGNATFAGNSLALIFPVSLVLALVAVTAVLRPGWLALDRPEDQGGEPPAASWAVLAGIGATLLLQVGVSALLHGGVRPGARETYFKLAYGASAALMFVAAVSGSRGPAWGRAGSPGARRFADGYVAGALLMSALFIGAGLYTTRTRGAWVGTAAAIGGGLLLVPSLAAGPALKRARVFGLSALGLLTVGLLVLLVAFPDHVASKTIKSIPYAFMPEHTVYGQGQGTRPYLWKESPRVLTHHKDTLERKYKDMSEAAEKVSAATLERLGVAPIQAKDEGQRSFDRTWRSAAVWLFGIGIETYRYAFMSHKSKKLEALDPMTNHDNPHNNYLYTLASFGLCGLLAYVWLLWRLSATAFARFWRRGEDAEPMWLRALALGIVMSFFSYSFYSIAGFDSVACSVFLYLLLGAAAVALEPQEDEPARPLLENLRRHWEHFRGRDPGAARGLFVPALVLVIPLLILLGLNVRSAVSVHAAERAFVGRGGRGDLLDKIEDIEAAIRLNPHESFYKQNLGSSYGDLAAYWRKQAVQAERQGKTGEAQGAAQEAQSALKKAEEAMYAALDHAWAPENVFISAFQIYYLARDLEKAEYALERGLEHSPHLGAVRANLAVLKLERGAWKEALADAEWVLEVDPKSSLALRTAGRASHKLGRPDEARRFFDRALALSPGDPLLKEYAADLARGRTASAASPG